MRSPCNRAHNFSRKCSFTSCVGSVTSYELSWSYSNFDYFAKISFEEREAASYRNCIEGYTRSVPELGGNWFKLLHYLNDMNSNMWAAVGYSALTHAEMHIETDMCKQTRILMNYKPTFTQHLLLIIPAHR